MKNPDKKILETIEKNIRLAIARFEEFEKINNNESYRSDVMTTQMRIPCGLAFHHCIGIMYWIRKVANDDNIISLIEENSLMLFTFKEDIGYKLIIKKDLNIDPLVKKINYLSIPYQRYVLGLIDTIYER
jgi:hypothetical protein